MESVCDKPQAARTRGPKIRVVGAIRVDNPQAGRAECRGKALQAIVVRLLLPRAALRLPPGYLHRQADVYCLPGKASSFTRLSFVLHSSFFTFTLHLSNGLCFIALCIVL